jgi:hypothetical protein
MEAVKEEYKGKYNVKIIQREGQTIPTMELTSKGNRIVEHRCYLGDWIVEDTLGIEIFSDAKFKSNFSKLKGFKGD